jgi:hypothetical protein
MSGTPSVAVTDPEGSHERCDRERGVAAARRDVEHAIAGMDVEALQQRACGRRRHRACTVGARDPMRRLLEPGLQLGAGSRRSRGLEVFMIGKAQYRKACICNGLRNDAMR